MGTCESALGVLLFFFVDGDSDQLRLTAVPSCLLFSSSKPHTSKGKPTKSKQTGGGLKNVSAPPCLIAKKMIPGASKMYVT